MKVILASVTASISLNPQAVQGVTHSREACRPIWNRSVDSSSGINGSINQDSTAHPSDAEFAVRNMEIEAKAASAIILLLLKWLKISRQYYRRVIVCTYNGSV